VTSLPAAIACFRSKDAIEFAASDTAGRSTMPSIAIVAVAAEAAVLAITMFVITAEVSAGTVYRVALVVAAACLANALVVVAINYYTFLFLVSAHDVHHG
jgi:hypothetical protein